MQAIKIHRPTLKIMWKLLAVLFFPFTIWLYSVVVNIPFNVIDDGVNYHKWIIFFIYLTCLAIWLYVDRILAHSSFFNR